jgi:RNA polymerase sigma-70 factor (ECF subfamily)
VAGKPPVGDLAAELGPWMGPRRTQLTRHCCRLLGSPSEAEDAVQETLVRAWRSIDRFERRSSMQAWLYRIATNICWDMRASPQRRALPQGSTPGSSRDGLLVAEALAGPERAPDGRAAPEMSDPAEAAVLRDNVRGAFVAALERLPPRQLAVMILREVLRWRAAEVAELLGTTVMSVNSSLQRARRTLATSDVGRTLLGRTTAHRHRLLGHYVEALERRDSWAFVNLLRAEEATAIS